MQLDVAAAERAVGALAKQLKMTLAETAAGILRIAVTTMSYAVKGVSTERGLDAAAFPLIAYGGAGPLHASAIAREIGIRRLIVPHAPGHFCAFGMLHSDLRYDYVRTWFTPLLTVSFDALAKVYAELVDEGQAALARSAVKPKRVTIGYAVDMRYVGQEHPCTVHLPPAVFKGKDAERTKRTMKTAFDAEHEQRYGTCAPEERAEIVSVRVTVSGILAKPPLAKITRGTAIPPKAASTGRRSVYFAEVARKVATPIYARDALRAGNRLNGPALIEEHASTTVLLPGDQLVVDAYGNLDMTVARRRG